MQILTGSNPWRCAVQLHIQQCTLSLRISTSAPPTAVATAASNTGGEGEEAARSLLLTVCGRLEFRALRVLDPLSLSSLPSLSFPPTYYDTTTSRFCLWQSNTRECYTFLASEASSSFVFCKYILMSQVLLFANDVIAAKQLPKERECI